MNKTDFIMLRAMVESMRTYFMSLLPRIFDFDDQMVWMAKYFLWRFERENLAPYSWQPVPKSLDLERIDRRRYQLQVLMDVAYILGHLEEFGIIRKISSHAYRKAMHVFAQSDGSEGTMVPLID